MLPNIIMQTVIVKIDVKFGNQFSVQIWKNGLDIVGHNLEPFSSVIFFFEYLDIFAAFSSA